MTTIRYPILHDREALLALAEEHRPPAVAMAAAIGCTRYCITEAFRRHGTENPYHKAHRQYPALIERAWVKRRYIAEGRSLREIAAEFGCTATPVLRALCEWTRDYSNRFAAFGRVGDAGVAPTRVVAHGRTPASTDHRAGRTMSTTTGPRGRNGATCWSP